MGLSKEQKNLIDKQLDLVLKLNEIHNLTNITDKKQAEILHIKDSLYAVDFINQFDQKESFVDLGSGSGYPGICLSIATNIPCTLIESIQKKADCLKTIILELGLEKRISVSNCRIEEYSINAKNKYDFATARALAPLPCLLELAAPLLKLQGHLICYKGSNIDDELNRANEISDKLGYHLVLNKAYSLENDINHRIVIYKKVANSNIQLPRRNGLAQKRPLS